MFAKTVFELARFEVTTLLVRSSFSAEVSEAALGNVIVNTDVLVTDAIVCTLLYLLASDAAFPEPEICIFWPVLKPCAFCVSVTVVAGEPEVTKFAATKSPVNT